MQDALLGWYTFTRESYPWRMDWKRTKNPFYIWLSEIMLQQTTIQTVIPAYLRFTTHIRSIEDLCHATDEEVRLLARGLGYYRRFTKFHEAAKMLGHTECFPKTFWNLVQIPGIGDYTAAAIASICFNEVRAVVDGNVERILCRLFDIRKPINDKTLKSQYQKIADSLVSPTQPGDYNQALMELGQKICRPKNPQCFKCPIQSHCLAYRNESQHLAPGAKINKPKMKEIELHMQIDRLMDGRLVVQRRQRDAKFFPDELGFRYENKFTPSMQLHYDLIGSFKHSITRHKITALIYVATIRKIKYGQAYTADEIEPLLLSNLDRKCLQFYLNHPAHLEVAPPKKIPRKSKRSSSATNSPTSSIGTHV